MSEKKTIYIFKSLLKKFFLFIIIFSSQTTIYGQHKFGGRLGVSINLGSIQKGIGIILNGFYVYNFIQINAQIKAVYNYSSFGPRISGNEFQTGLGAILAYGDMNDTIKTFFFSPVDNYTNKKFAGGYFYNAYFDKTQTSQRTGTISLQIDKFQFVTENDILAGEVTDKFRTAAIGAYYFFEDYKVGINSILWTCDVLSKNVKKVRDTDFPSHYGYFDTSKAKYKQYSHGIVSMQLESGLPYSQNARLNLGIDSEHIRNAIQNRFMHDMYFFRENWNKARNPHVPMVDEKGEPYLYKPNQKIKAPKFYWNLSSNGTLFY